MKFKDIKQHVLTDNETREHASVESIEPELLDLVSGGASAGTASLPVDDRFLNAGWTKAF